MCNRPPWWAWVLAAPMGLLLLVVLIVPAIILGMVYCFSWCMDYLFEHAR